MGVCVDGVMALRTAYAIDRPLRFMCLLETGLTDRNDKEALNGSGFVK
jgi:hypothetical protein